MKQVFLAPRSGEQSAENFKKTIEGGYKKSDLLPVLKEEDRNALSQEEIFFIWGNRPGGRAPWERMEKDDYVFFYQHGNITYVGKMLYKTHNKELADKLWGPYTKGNITEYWEYIYFLHNMVEVNIDYSILKGLAGYKANAVVQGFQSYRNEGIQKINEKYGSIENFINDYKVQEKSVNHPGSNLRNVTAEMSEKIHHIHQYILSKGFQYGLKDIGNFYLSLKTKPFVILAGISGTGKTQLVRKFAEAINAECELIPVKPDWTDNTDLIGYKNLEDKFQEKQLLRIINIATQNPEKIYFALLDEMNLARVEHYFSDFLSLIETREIIDGKIVTERILDEADLGDRVDLANLHFPENFYLIGTVNMDETTHPFSRKVLDRANSIELSEVSLSWNEEGSSLPTLEGITNKFLRAKYLRSSDLEQKEKDILKDVLKQLIEINGILKSADLQFGYRVRDEICFYMIYQKEIEDIISLEEALDYQIMQKILPRIQGSSIRIKRLIIDLIKYLSNKNSISDSYEYSEIEKEVKEVQNFKKALNKLLFMLRRYNDDGFTSFWL
jgi:hypothetical protein